MKKEVLLGFFIVLLIFNMYFIIADELNISESNDEESKVNQAYTCLEERVKDKCSKLSSEERIFSLLAIQKCKDEVIADSKNNQCWPKSNCKIKTTAQAILALKEVNVDTSEAKEWLLSQNMISLEIDWYLEIESPESTTCTITYSGTSHSIVIGADKKLSSGAGSCLSLIEGAWWLRISPSCYSKEFEISCDKQFLTTLLFKKKTSSTIHVSEKINSASAEGKTTEKVDSSCFAQGGSCNYEGSLWATLILDYLGEDTSSYLPYLVTMADENLKHIPDAFLYILTGEFRVELLAKQKSNKYWDESGDKFYDTALALYPFQYEEPIEKTGSIEWLLEVQDSSGCWQGGIRNTAFILYSIWPRTFGDIIDDEIDCEETGYYCMSAISCQEAGSVLDYDCSGVFVCCDKEKSLATCNEQGGEICNSNENCIGGTTVEALDTSYGEHCCAGGFCEEPAQVSECEEYFGTCRSYECNENEEQTDLYDCDYESVCCIEKEAKSKNNYWWIWILVLLIFLVLLGIIFRDKLRAFWFRAKSKFGKSKPSSRRPRFPPAFPARPVRRAMPRRILPPTQRLPAKRPLIKKPKGELDSVLKKLKDMGK